MGKGQAVLLGLNGHIGRAAAEAFATAGWNVTGMARAERFPVPGVRFVAGDAGSVDDIRHAIGDADIVVNALNLPYAAWDRGRKEALMARVIEALGTCGRTVLFPGNIYNFAATDRIVAPGMPQHPQTPRGAIRVRVERMFEEAAARGDIQAIILRAGDFYGPGSANDWFDLAILAKAKKHLVQPMGLPGIGHAWAYLPDLARAFEALASLRRSLGAFEQLHFAGHYVTPEDMSAAIVAAAPVPVKVRRFPLGLIRLAGLVDPTMREIAKMRYLWTHPMRLEDVWLDALLGPGFATPFETAIADTVAPFFAAAPISEPERDVNVGISAA